VSGDPRNGLSRFGERPDAHIGELGFINGPHRDLTDLPEDLVAHVRAMAAATVATHVPPEGPVLPEPLSDTWARAQSIDVPVLTISGDLDSTDHINAARRLAETVRDGRAVVIDGTGHYPNLERAEEFTNHVRSFASSLPPNQGRLNSTSARDSIQTRD